MKSTTQDEQTKNPDNVARDVRDIHSICFVYQESLVIVPSFYIVSNNNQVILSMHIWRVSLN